MQIDRRITNGLAWAGAALVIGIPVLDFAMRQVSPETPRAVVVAPEVAEEAAAPAVSSTAEPSAPSQAATPSAQTETVAPTQPQQTASASGDAVDRFIETGRPLPSYISGSEPAPTPAATAPVTPAPAPAPVATPTPAAETPARPVIQTPVQTEPSAPPAVAVTMPTPVSQRPPSRPAIGPTLSPPPAAVPALQPQQPLQPQSPQPVQPQLVLDDGGPLITAEDLEDWESGPLSEFLANRANQRGQQVPVTEYEPEGFFLDDYYSGFGQ